MSDVKLYDRNPAYIPRVAAVHDMCGYGKCSLTAAIPILSAAGCDVCPVPTGLFSSHTKYPVFTFHDTTEILNGYLDAWGKIGVGLDGVYSGFLGSADQVAVIQRLYHEYPGALRLVDPVMGDGGQIYPTYTAELCEAMGALADGADVLMPNLTEASILTGRDYPGQNLDDAEVTDWLDALLKLGARNVVLNPRSAIMGEVGLAGEVRAVGQAQRRIAECARMGFDQIILPAGNLRGLKEQSGVTLYGVKTVAEALAHLL